VRAWVHGALYRSGGLWTIRAGDDLVGMLAISERERVGWIDQLYLRPGATGRGIGSIALEHAVGVLPPPVRLYTFQANSGARRFYERHGFRAISFSDNSNNEERCPDVLYERTGKDG
jgi:GNAT superfamily N-acetyltransferase